MKFTIGFSPCPNDTFIFDALINGMISNGGHEFEPVLEDVETLNRWAIEGKLDITKLSYGVLPLALPHYRVLDSGSALGKGVGPLLISRADFNPDATPVEDQLIAIPGEHTTAHLLFSLAYPQASKKTFIRYDGIEDFVLSGKGLGVIIHENRFTFAAKGLQKITDLGNYWETTTGQPIPLGGIVIRKDFPIELQTEIETLIRESIEYAYQRYPELSEYIRCHAQEMSEDVMRQHINLYVNEHSLSLGDTGKTAILKLMDVYQSTHHAAIDDRKIFAGS